MILRHETFDLTHDSQTREVAVPRFEANASFASNSAMLTLERFLKKKFRFANIQHVRNIVAYVDGHQSHLYCLVLFPEERSSHENP